jgi:hypothetical protein
MATPKKPSWYSFWIIIIGAYGISILLTELFLSQLNGLSEHFLRWAGIGVPLSRGAWVILTPCLMFIAVLVNIPTWIVFTRWRRNYGRYKRWTAGHCPECGYDLRAHLAAGSTAGKNCPECGTPIAERDDTIRKGERSSS